MAHWRISDRWLAVGLLTVAYFGACLISWHKGEAARVNANSKLAERQDEALRQAEERGRQKTEDGNYDIGRLHWRP